MFSGLGIITKPVNATPKNSNQNPANRRQAHFYSSPISPEDPASSFRKEESKMEWIKAICLKKSFTR